MSDRSNSSTNQVAHSEITWQRSRISALVTWQLAVKKLKSGSTFFYCSITVTASGTTAPAPFIGSQVIWDQVS